MYGCPPKDAPAPTLSPANPADLMLLRACARREIAAINRTIADSTHPRDVTIRPLFNRRAAWQRIDNMATALLDSAQLIVRHELPQSWRQRATSPTFWVGVLAGLAIAAALQCLP